MSTNRIALPIPSLADTLSRRTRYQIPQSGKRFRESAVLLPLLLSERETWELLFIVRQTDLSTHSGQIAFPGGKHEAADPSLLHTALRESSEEVGLAAERVEVCGMLDDVPTTDFFAITPVVGMVRGALSLSPSAKEVSDVFSAPLLGLADCYRHAGHAEWQGIRYVMHEFLWRDFQTSSIPGSAPGLRRIWGATARITYQLLELLQLLPPISDD